MQRIFGGITQRDIKIMLICQETQLFPTKMHTAKPLYSDKANRRLDNPASKFLNSSNGDRIMYQSFLRFFDMTLQFINSIKFYKSVMTRAPQKIYQIKKDNQCPPLSTSMTSLIQNLQTWIPPSIKTPFYFFSRSLHSIIKSKLKLNEGRLNSDF